MVQAPKGFKTIQNLGQPLAVYPPRWRSIWRLGNALLAGICLVGGSLTLTWGLWDASLRYYHHGPAIIERGLVLPLVLAILLFATGIYLGWIYGTRFRKTLVLFERGLAFRDAGKLTAAAWEEVASLRRQVIRQTWLGFPNGVRRIYTLIRSDGERIILDDSLDRVEKAVNDIRQFVYPVLYNRYSAAFDQGHELFFGPVHIRKDDGIDIKQKKFGWNEIQKANVDNGVFTLMKPAEKGKKQQVKIPAADIPNLEILLTFIHQMTS